MGALRCTHCSVRLLVLACDSFQLTATERWRHGRELGAFPDLLRRLPAGGPELCELCWWKS